MHTADGRCTNRRAPTIIEGHRKSPGRQYDERSGDIQLTSSLLHWTDDRFLIVPELPLDGANHCAAFELGLADAETPFTSDDGMVRTLTTPTEIVSMVGRNSSIVPADGGPAFTPLPARKKIDHATTIKRMLRRSVLHCGTNPLQQWPDQAI